MNLTQPSFYTNYFPYIAANTEISSNGYLKALQIYAQTSGNIVIQLVRVNCANGTSWMPRNQDFKCYPYKLYSTYDCNNSYFLRSTHNCESYNKSSRYYGWPHNGASVIYTFNLYLNVGYNFFAEDQLGFNLEVSANLNLFDTVDVVYFLLIKLIDN